MMHEKEEHVAKQPQPTTTILSPFTSTILPLLSFNSISSFLFYYCLLSSLSNCNFINNSKRYCLKAVEDRFTFGIVESIVSDLWMNERPRANTPSHMYNHVNRRRQQRRQCSWQQRRQCNRQQRRQKSSIRSHALDLDVSFQILSSGS